MPRQYDYPLTVHDLPMDPKPDDWEGFAADIKVCTSMVAAYFERVAILQAVNSTSGRNRPDPHQVKLLVMEALSDIAGDLFGQAMNEHAEAMEHENV